MSSASFVCPFCPLHCDDLQAAKLVRDDAAQAAAAKSAEAGTGGEACVRLQQHLVTALEHHRSPAASAAAITTAQQWVERAQQICITGRILDLQTARSVCRFAEQTGADVQVATDPAATAETAAYLESFTRDGGFATTLGDAAAPHTSVILIGDPAMRWPRLQQRLARAGKVYTWQNTERLSERLAHLRRLVRRPAEPEPVADPDLATCRALCEQAVFLLFVVVPETLDAAEALPFWSSMTGLLRDLNGRIRAAILRFDETVTARSVQAWSGLQTPVTALAQVRSAADLVIELVPWDDLAHGDRRRAMPEAHPAARRIVIGWQPEEPGVIAVDRICYLPASVGGIGRAAIVLRGDGSVALPLRPLVETTLPAPAELLEQLAPKRPLGRLN